LKKMDHVLSVAQSRIFSWIIKIQAKRLNIVFGPGLRKEEIKN
jgi:hypothetical protein